MKQHITAEQFEELSYEAQRKLFHFYFPNIPVENRPNGSQWGVIDINPEYVTIGRMIEYLGENWWIHFFAENDGYGIGIEKIYDGEFCDALWEAVKEILNKDS